MNGRTRSPTLKESDSFNIKRTSSNSCPILYQFPPEEQDERDAAENNRGIYVQNHPITIWNAAERAENNGRAPRHYRNHSAYQKQGVGFDILAYWHFAFANRFSKL